jgi:hypothetical protein
MNRVFNRFKVSGMDQAFVCDNGKNLFEQGLVRGSAGRRKKTSCGFALLYELDFA